MTSTSSSESGHHLRRERRGLIVVFGMLVLGTIGYVYGPALVPRYQLYAARRSIERGDLPAAQQHIESCFLFAPDDGEAHFLAARIGRRSSQLALAWSHLLECDQLLPPCPERTREWALLKFQTGDYDPKLEAFLWSLVENGDPQSIEVLEALADGYRETYRLSKALACADALLRRHPDSIPGLLSRGCVLRCLGHKELARVDYRHAVDLDPDNHGARLGLGELLLEDRIGNPDEAAEQFEFLRQFQPKMATVLLGLACCRRWQGRSGEARQLLDHLVTAHPRNALALLDRGRLALELNQPTDAERWLHRAMEIAPQSYAITGSLAQCYRLLNQPDKAQRLEERIRPAEEDARRLRELLRSLAGDLPRTAQQVWEAGVLLLRQDREKDALRWFGIALQLEPRHQPTHQALLDYHERRGNRREARHHRMRLAEQIGR